LVQASDLEERVTKMEEENKRLREMLKDYNEKYKVLLQNKMEDRTDCSSPSENQQNAASPTKKRKLENDFTVKLNGVKSSAWNNEAFRNEGPSSREACMKFQEELKSKFTKIIMQTDPSDTSLVSGINWITFFSWECIDLRC
jgi:hypothetical protein